MRIKLLCFILALCLSNNVLFSQKRTFICINENNEILFSFESNYVWPFSDNLAMFKTYNDINGERIWRTGFIDTTGNIIIPPIYDNRDVSKYGFKDGVSWVKQHKDSMYVLIDKKNNIISEKSYHDVGRFKNGICAVFCHNKMGFIDNSGKEIIPCIYIGDTEFNDDLVFVSEIGINENKYGFINKSGEVVLPFIYDKSTSSKFKNGECVVRINGKVHLINKNGEIIFTPALSNNMKIFSNELALSHIEKNGEILYGFFNKDNEWIIYPKYENAHSFINDRAIVKQDNKYGVIDSDENIIIPIVFDKIIGNCNTSAFFSCLKNRKYSFFDCNGRPFGSNNINKIKSRHNTNIYPFRNNLNKWGYLNQDGSIKIEAQYDYAEPFSENKAWVY